MKFSEQTDFVYDPAVFSRLDTQTALKIHREYVHRHGPMKDGVPAPKFFEVDRSPGQYDPLWHEPIATPAGVRLQFTARSPLAVPAINQFVKPDWKVTRLGITPNRRDNFWVANLDLKALDYFPRRGDVVFWRGYRYEIMNAVVPPESYWQQTGVWLGMMIECVVPPGGDVQPLPLPELPSLQPGETSANPVDGPSRLPQGPLQVEYPLPQNAPMLPDYIPGS